MSAGSHAQQVLRLQLCEHHAQRSHGPKPLVPGTSGIRGNENSLFLPVTVRFLGREG